MKIVIKSWCRAKNGAKALEVLNEMTQSFDISPDLVSYTTVMNAYAMERTSTSGFNSEKVFRAMLQKHNNDLEPDTICYTSLIDAYAQSSSLEAAIRAETILEEILSIVTTKNNMNVMPNTITLNCVLKAWLNSDFVNSGYRANLLVNKIESKCKGSNDDEIDYKSLSPNLSSYITVIQCYAKNKLKDSDKNAYELFQKVNDLSKEETSSSSKRKNVFAINTSLYNNLINAYASSGTIDSAIAAEDLYYLPYNHLLMRIYHQMQLQYHLL